MKKLFNKVKSIFLKKDFFIFVAIGVINTFNGTLFSMLYSSLGLQANIAFACGYITSLFIAYILNSIFTFKEKLSLNKLIKFAISYIPNFIVQSLCVYVIYNVLNYDKLIAYLVAAVIGIPVTFLLLKFYAFSKKKQIINRSDIYGKNCRKKR
jgi:putative flippase GtrA